MRSDFTVNVGDAGLTWSAGNLNRWLSSPKQFIPGVKMPVSVPDPIARRDIIAYLRQQSEHYSSSFNAKSAEQGTGY